jgi:hypothetical protein
MAIKLKEVNVQIAKELDEVFLMLNEVIRLVKAGEPITNALDELVVAIDGVSEVPQGFQENLLASLRTVTLRAADTVEMLLRPKVVKAEAK